MVLRIIEGFEIEFQRKKIKKMHLHIRKDGTILLTAPMRVPESDILKFISDESDWIREHRTRIQNICESDSHRYDSGSILYLLGHPYELNLSYGTRPSVVIYNDNLIMTITDNMTFETKEKLLNEFYRKILKEKLALLIPKWEEKMGLYCSGWQTKIMTTRWGTCNTRTKKIWFSVRLCEKSEDLIEYVIVHELAHILINNHGPEFKRLMDIYVPDWKEKRKRLNSLSSR